VPELIEAPEKNMHHAYGVWLLDNKHRFIKQLQKVTDPSLHGTKTWDSSYLLMDYFSQPGGKKKRKVLDVGVGWGPAAIFMASKGHKVTGLDPDEDVFPYLRVQSELNDVSVAEKIGGMDAMKKKDLQEFDLIIGADICFWDELVDEWFKLIRRAAQAGVKQLVLADPGRETFLELAERCDKKYDTDMLAWYALEPKRYEGFLLVVNLND
jgi:predicted nicotinamide N-methyase